MKIPALAFSLAAVASLVAMASLASGAALPASGQTAPAPGASTFSVDAWQQELQGWRVARAHTIDAPDGWLTLTGLEWLKPGLNSLGAAPDSRIKLRVGAPDHLGLVTVSGSTVQLLAPAGGFPADLTISGKPAREGPLTVDNLHPTVLAWHGISLAVLSRDNRYLLRIKDEDSPARTAFRGLYWYPPDPSYRVVANWIPYTPTHVEQIPTILGTTLDLPSPGVARFILNGHTLELEPVLEDPAAKTLFFILRDTTSTTTTYQAARFLHTGLPDHGLSQPGQLVLDFNRLENPPCAYTQFAICPLPPDQNRLPIDIEAGERRYQH